MPKRRVFKVAEQIRAIIAQELTRMADPRLGLLTVTSVVVSNDLRHAKVYWTCSGDPDSIEAGSTAFEKARGHFRRTLAEQLGLRFVPDLKFFYDDTLDVVEEVEGLITRIHKGGEQSTGEPGD